MKQWNLHRRFKRWWYYSGGLNVYESENKWNKLNSDYFINYVVIFLKKIKPLQTYIERSSFHRASYLRVNWFRCEGTQPLRCEVALEEAASVDDVGGVGASSWEAPKEISLSLLDKLAATVRERPALLFILRFYTILYK